MRTETIKFNVFMSDNYNKKKKLQPMKAIAKGSITIPILSTLTGKYAFAAEVEETTKQAVIHAFDPLLELMVDLALPISGVILTSGALLILIGMKDKGFSLILNASLGYCIVQLSPLFISLLAEVGKAL
ncbi:hypothetical protein B4065_0192 [Caldibacillus thermoamylovorans]|uniref:hypothetical protein n=1 Tax=Caldibacillus thermoamylovorans TaxID=35841 RepID=UPI0005B729B0|nr:hypothetical protein [Caldibacillus thermoamylovorans]KIO60266.1 hypothetical protein B4065_0192 [Caldibacillus thermoamylovorans]